MKWLLDDDVYMQRSACEAVFYDIRNGRYAIYPFMGDGCEVENNIVTWKEDTEQLKVLMRFLSDNGMAREIPPGGPVLSLMGGFEMLKEQFRWELEGERRDVWKDMLVELTLCVNGMGDEGRCRTSLLPPFNWAVEGKTIPVDSILKVFRQNHFQNLKKIVLAGYRLWEDGGFRELYDFLAGRYPVEICVPVEDFLNPEFAGWIESERLAGVRVVCDAVSLEEIGSGMLKGFPVLWDVYVKSVSGLEKATAFKVENVQHQVNIIPFPADNLSFLSKVLSYTWAEVLKSRHTKMSIVRKGLVDELTWGRLVVGNDGDVYASCQTDCGNIGREDFGGILLQAAGAWRFTRSEFGDCRQCCLNCLCPPVTAVEIESGRTYCRKDKAGKMRMGKGNFNIST